MTALPPILATLRGNSAGVLLLAAGIAIFAVQDLILKLLSGAYPLHQAMVIRSLTALPLLALLVRADGGLRSLLTPGWRLMVRRGVVMFLAYTLYYLALAALPLATTVALYFSAPLFITVLSVPLLGEKVGRHRWTAIAVGFAGVVVMARPGTDVFDWAALMAVASGLTYALSMVWARSLGRTQSASAMAFWGNAVFLVFALLLAAVFGSGAFEGAAHPSLAFLTRGWVMPDLADVGLMMACGAIAAVGLSLLTQAYRIGEASIVAPFEYTAMIWGVLYGWVFFRDWPLLSGWVGITIIVGAGLFVIWRERKAGAA